MQRKKIDRRVMLGLGGAAAGTFFASRTLAGSLEPPGGSPSPTGRSLQEVEPRVAVNGLSSGQGAVHQITAGGSYKLTGPITAVGMQVGIRVSTSDPVSIDLNGFTISGSGGGGGGILVDSTAPGCAYVEVFDGYIRNMAGDGIDGGTARVLEVNDVHIDNVHRGVVGRASLTVEGCLIERCTSDGIVWEKTSAQSVACIIDDTELIACQGTGLKVAGNWSVGTATASLGELDVSGSGGHGIHVDLQTSGPGGAGQLSMCMWDVQTAQCGGRGIDVQAPAGAGGIGASMSFQCEDVVCKNNSSGGLRAADVSVDLIDCVCTDNLGDGFTLENTQGSIDNCMALKNTADGIHVTGGSSRMSVSENAAHSNGSTGIHLDVGVTGTPVQDNDARDQATGIHVASPGNLLVRNSASNNGANYQVPAPVVIITPAQMVANSNPHANYSFP